MNINLFKMALDRLESSDWAHFEQLCSSFLISEFANLRTMAHPSGDGGRDSELFSPENQPFISAQYSVAADWKTKIRKTAKRLKSTFSDLRILVYMSNRQIGGQADELKRELLDQSVALDIRDRSWFLERVDTDEIRENAALELIDRIARPYLEGEDLINKRSSPLTSGEAKAALLYLGLQWQDDITDKGLTKLSFDALVRAALRNTHSDKRMSRHEIHKAVCSAISSNDRKVLHKLVDTALARLTKRYIRHWQKEDEFCLTHDEHQRIIIRLAEIENQESEFFNSVSRHCGDCLREIDERYQTDQDDLYSRVPRVIEKLLLKRGENFVSSVLSDRVTRIDSEDLKDIILRDLQDQPVNSKIIHHYPKIITTVVQELLSQPDKSTQLYLRRLANSYTLLSFLNQTPDVQNATKKLFSHGTVWLDTTVLLPLFAEQIEEDKQQGKLSKLFSACLKAGVEFRVTTGVIQEINAHMNNAVQCSKFIPGTWRGRIPFLYYRYLQTGQPPIEFRKWISLFRGSERPDDDLSQFLKDSFEIKREDLKEVVKNISDDLRWTADRLWTEAHKLRRTNAQQIDEETTRILIQHDIETYLGVIALRQKEEVSELGYRHWLLTLDTIAWEIRDRLKEELKEKTPTSPLLSLSFLLNNMTFGPSRRLTGKTDELTIPLVLDIEMSESMPHDILDIADRVRNKNEGLSEYVIRRKVRDAIDRARRRKGLAIITI
jgi:predicted nucleic-acid-binding protein